MRQWIRLLIVIIHKEIRKVDYITHEIKKRRIVIIILNGILWARNKYREAEH